MLKTQMHKILILAKFFPFSKSPTLKKKNHTPIKLRSYKDIVFAESQFTEIVGPNQKYFCCPFLYFLFKILNNISFKIV